MVVLDKGHGATDGFLEPLLIKALEEEAALVLEYTRFDQDNIGDFQRGGFQGSLFPLYSFDWPEGVSVHGFLEDAPQVRPVTVLEQGLRQSVQLLGADPALAVGDLFRAGDL